MNIKTIIKKPKYLLYYIDQLGLHILDDKTYLEMQYELFMGEKLDLDNPKTFNQKLQWLKLNDRNPEYVKMVDKYESKKYVESIIGEKYIIKTLGVYNSFDEIDFDALPNQFVIKCTHDSGGVVICRDKSTFNINEAKKKINKHLAKNYFYQFREWPYKDVKPRIMVEEYLQNFSEGGIIDYKFYCFDGEPQLIDVCTNRHIKLEQTYFDINWNKHNVTEGGSATKNNLKKPTHFEEMVSIVKKLSAGRKHVRIDLYEIDDKVYFGEITFYSGAGMEQFDPKEFDYKVGAFLNI